MDIHPTAAAGFSAAADVYERARPGYPDRTVAWFAERLGIGPAVTCSISRRYGQAHATARAAYVTEAFAFDRLD